MIYFGKQEHSDEYFSEGQHQSQSMLKLLLTGLDLYKSRNDEQGSERLHYEEKGHFVLGKAVDCYMTQGKDEFERQFHVSNAVKPSPLVMSMVQHVFDSFNLGEGGNGIDESITLSQLTDFIEEAIEAHAYQPKWKMETKVAAVIRDGSSYFQGLIESLGKQVLSEEESTTVMGIVMAFMSHPHTIGYFRNFEEHQDVYYQVPIYSEIEGVLVKGLLDQIIIDHKHKTIKPNDIKTMGDYTTKFKYSLDSRRYDFQGSFYLHLIHLLLQGIGSSPVITPEVINIIKDYKILPFRFIVESTTKPGTPLIFEMSPETVERGYLGRPELEVRGHSANKEGNLSYDTYPITYKKVNGYTDGIEQYKWYQENGWDTDREIVESKGLIII